MAQTIDFSAEDAAFPNRVHSISKSRTLARLEDEARSKRPKVLDLYCCAGGAGMGYFRAGFDVYGVDIDPQPRYPFAFRQDDVLSVLATLLAGQPVGFLRPDGEVEVLYLSDFAFIHASPPCQAFSSTKSLHANSHPDLVAPTRELLQRTGLVWIMENVVGAPLEDPLLLCGTEFGLQADDVDGVRLKLVRHRLFESNVHLERKGKCNHDRSILTASVYGAGGGWSPEHRDSAKRRGGYVPDTDVCRQLLGVDWTTKHELSQVVPPAFTEHLGKQVLSHLA